MSHFLNHLTDPKSPNPTGHSFLFPKIRDNVEEKHKLGAASPYPVLYESSPYRFKEPTSDSIYPSGSRASDRSGLGVGAPVTTSFAEAAKVDFLQNNFCNSLESPRNLFGSKGDLSLRLGLSSEPCFGMEGSSAHEGDKNKPTTSSLQVSMGICTKF